MIFQVTSPSTHIWAVHFFLWDVILSFISKLFLFMTIVLHGSILHQALYQFQCLETNLKIKIKAEAPTPHLPITSTNLKRSTLSSYGTPSCGRAPSHIMNAVFTSNYIDSTQVSYRHFPGVKCIHSTVWLFSGHSRCKVNTRHCKVIILW